MPVVASCTCGKQFRAPDTYRGKRVRCPGCGGPLNVPLEDEPLTVVPAPPAVADPPPPPPTPVLDAVAADVPTVEPAPAAPAVESPVEAARLLYDVLHRCDSLEVGSIVVVMPPQAPEWQAIRDRLLRATRPLAERE